MENLEKTGGLKNLMLSNKNKFIALLEENVIPLIFQ